VKGWDRASFEMKTHPPHPRRRVTQRDFLVPLYADRLRRLGAALLGGLCISILWVYFPLFVVSVVLNEKLGAWLWGSMLVTAAVSGALIFALSSLRGRRYLEHA
jgi:hypothetical protein